MLAPPLARGGAFWAGTPRGRKSGGGADEGKKANRPISTTLADSQNQPQTPLADSASDYTDYTEPKPDMADSQVPPAQVEPPQADQPATPPTEAQTPSQPSTPSEPVSGGSIQDSLPSGQPLQVQPEPQEATSSASAPEEPRIAPESAEIKPEPPHGTREAPLADLPSEVSTKEDSEAEKPAKTTFGDLAGEPRPSPASVTPPISPIPPTSPAQSEPVLEAKADFSSKRQQALQVRRKRREERLAQILSFVSQKGKINNKNVCNLLRVSQSTATNYLKSLVKHGKLKKEGKGKVTKYFL